MFILKHIQKRLLVLLLFLSSTLYLHANPAGTNELSFYNASHAYIQYTGRIDFKNKLLPRFWSPGIYIQFKFKGPVCKVVLNDEVLYGNTHNYIELVVDGNARRLQLKAKTDTIDAGDNLSAGEHSLIICKNTESNIGYMEMVGIYCKELLQPDAKPIHKIECIGNSITCGMGNDDSEIACGKGQWYDQHNAWMSYASITARSLNAQWHLSSVSGIGLIHSCCDLSITMPRVFDQMNLREIQTNAWNFNNYQPDVVTICLGQNDGIQDSTAFCSAYVSFLQQLRSYYPNSTFICLTSPMGDATLTAALKNYIGSVVSYMHKTGDDKTTCFFFSKQYNKGCTYHPNMEEHIAIAAELTPFIKKTMHW